MAKDAVVAETLNCEIVLSDLGFYARCTKCPWVTEKITASKATAREWAEAHDNS
jgi:hypothetical protein